MFQLLIKIQILKLLLGLHPKFPQIIKFNKIPIMNKKKLNNFVTLHANLNPSKKNH